MITARGICHAYGSVPVLHDVSVSAPTGRVLGLIGPNGSGKTTLLSVLAGTLRPDAGDVRVGARSLTELGHRDRARSIAMVPQDTAGELPMTVAEVVLLGRIPHRRLLGRWRDLDLELATDALRRVDALHLAGRVFSELSGGERQRVLVARAVTQSPRVLLLDEPTNHLDIGHQHEVLSLVRELGLTTIVVLHDLNLAARYCDHLALLQRGRIIQEGRPASVLETMTISDVYDVDVEERTAGDGIHQLLFRADARSAPAAHDVRVGDVRHPTEDTRGLPAPRGEGTGHSQWSLTSAEGSPA